jgi:hydrogenase nickel incorporation protein HypA/HybF
MFEETQAPMHELSIAQNIADIVQQYVPDEQAVQWVKVEIGRLSGIVPESLEFCFDAVVSETPLAGARLKIDLIPIRAACNRCNAGFEVGSVAFACPACGSADLHVISGTELKVIEIEVADRSSEAV